MRQSRSRAIFWKTYQAAASDLGAQPASIRSELCGGSNCLYQNLLQLEVAASEPITNTIRVTPNVGIINK